MRYDVAKRGLSVCRPEMLRYVIRWEGRYAIDAVRLVYSEFVENRVKR